ncbi:hypothetical protein CSUI_003176 [Cystoisospora suis]|uniref:Uncharacterized protein n=1 Tax=Cystoisospora suis TaxID=483139 RepID=A0A2C6L660_9APIC|nr:hypothetical protein CSUI_003176 [Cystoisospora suis]
MREETRKIRKNNRSRRRRRGREEEEAYLSLHCSLERTFMPRRERKCVCRRTPSSLYPPRDDHQDRMKRRRKRRRRRERRKMDVFHSSFRSGRFFYVVDLSR